MVAVDTWWQGHPLNEAVNGALTIVSPRVAYTLNPGDSIQEAINTLPFGPATIQLNGPGNYDGFNLLGRSNVHFVAPSGATIVTPSGTTDYKIPTVSIGPGYETIIPSTAYADYNAGVDIRSNSPIPWVTYFYRPVTNIYFKNITFDGGNKIVRPLTFTSCRRVMFDNCVWTNLRDSFEASGGTDAFHWGSITGNTRMENIYFRNCTFNGLGRWAIYLDGGHGCVIVGCTFAGSNYGSGGWVFLTNDDFSYSDVALGVATTDDEKRSASYCVFANNTFTGSLDSCLSYSGGHALVVNNTINQVHQPFGFTARGSNKWAQITNPILVYQHYGNMVIGNHITNVLPGAENGLQGLVYSGASHCGQQNTPSTFWDFGGTGAPQAWGRIGQFKIRDNVVADVAGLVLVNADDITGSGAGSTEGPHDVGNNTLNGGAFPAWP